MTVRRAGSLAIWLTLAVTTMAQGQGDKPEATVREVLALEHDEKSPRSRSAPTASASSSGPTMRR